MKYFVGIENKAYHHWQIELLIESFKMHKMDSQLVIGVGECEPGPTPFDVRNLKGHRNKFSHKKQKFYSLFSMLAALDNGMLTQPFAYIHPDMLMIRPLVLDGDDNITFHRSNYPDKELDNTKKNFPESLPWLNIGGLVVFQNTPTTYFIQALRRAKQLSKKRCDPIRGGLIASFYDHSKELTAKAENFESTLWHHTLDEGCFLHYRHGLPPLFSKNNYYKTSDSLILGERDPYNVLLQHNPTVSTNYMQKVIRSYADG